MVRLFCKTIKTQDDTVVGKPANTESVNTVAWQR